MPDNVTGKILRSHLVGGELAPGAEIAVRVDQTLLQDTTGTMACLQFEELSLERVAVPLAVQYVDHNLLQLDFKNPDDHRFLQAFAARYGLHFSRPGNGICHYVHFERFARPGAILVGADSHTTTSGALGMLAIGAGGLDVALCMAGHPFEFESPRIVGVELHGRLAPWVQAKDVVLELLRRRGVRNGLGRVFEFHGPGVATLDVAQRATICNMLVETGATTGLFPSDGRTREWLEQQQRAGDWVELAADPAVAYDEQELIELDQLEPLIAAPSRPGGAELLPRSRLASAGSVEGLPHAARGVVERGREWRSLPDLDSRDQRWTRRRENPNGGQSRHRSQRRWERCGRSRPDGRVPAGRP